jgi:hypothetical protein
LYAGSSTTTIGNPIGEVLDKLAAALPGDDEIRFVGKKGGGRPATRSLSAGQGVWPSEENVLTAASAMRQREHELLSRASVIGVGVGALDSDRAQAAIVVYVDYTSGRRPRLPKRISGVPVKVVYTEPIVAY